MENKLTPLKTEQRHSPVQALWRELAASSKPCRRSDPAAMALGTLGRAPLPGTPWLKVKGWELLGLDLDDVDDDDDDVSGKWMFGISLSSRIQLPRGPKGLWANVHTDPIDFRGGEWNQRLVEVRRCVLMSLLHKCLHLLYMQQYAPCLTRKIVRLC